ncbi:MAG: MFS transporter [archaeon]
MFYIKGYIQRIINHYFKNKEMNQLYTSVTIKALAESLIMIFVPIYLYNLGFGISAIALYYLIYFASVFVFQYFLMNLNYLLGLKKVLSLGTFVLIVYYLLLNYLSQGYIHYSFAALTFGLSVALYYSAFHIYFSEYSDNKREASQFSIVTSLISLATIVGPVVGAFFITNLSFSILSFIVAFLLLISTVPLFYTKDKKIKKPEISIKNILKADTKRKAIAYNAAGILSISTSIFWPLFIFIILKSVLSLGIIISVTSLFVVIAIVVIGRLSDKHKGKVLKLGVSSHALSWILRLLFLTPIGFFIMNLFSSISSLLIDISFSKYIYEKSKKSKNIANYFLFRELNLLTGRIAVLLIAIFTGSIYWTFILAFFVTFLHFVLLYDKK